ncbi:CRISPR-associated endonuclease Cas3'' [Pinisolibacter aquiterrae]|uniref:CRISPR-associated endonuclease Cas3'' n=1 Tax=Pinisolibacter aquiterrae TaxID=2815579 RepID=UPI001C3E82B5|nr:CRISPR-associated endonuclease Cas3'' [Pinisolibacter aquiterrae]MBV5263912.1 CRISPR-associated endonuclease Cas3'' [Pinisolibacter aquiterrae]MCC8235923.1 CRISPR-associated endonuclease Cas3'' [Pinisolibacter aquiterrae]
MFHAHSLPGRPESEWQPLSDHLTAVSELAADAAGKFGAAGAGAWAGRLHDLGKYTEAYQRRIRGTGPKVDHASAGARMLVELATAATTRTAELDRLVARIVAHAIAGHHTGLPDSLGTAGALAERMTNDLAALDPVWREEIATEPPRLWPDLDFRDPGVRDGALAFFGRMVFSALVDADWRDTEAFYARAEGRAIDRDWPKLGTVVDGLLARFDAHMGSLAGPESGTPLNMLRAEILAHVRAGAGREPGLFTLTVPTGGGKTLASLAFALEHARRLGLDRIVYAIPFTSIIEQTAAVFRDVLGDDMVLEHHSSLDETKFVDPESRDKLRLAMEDWAAPVVVTTNVQLFESLWSHKPSRCRRLHNLARAVIVLDEAQTIPLHVLRPCVAAIRELAARYGSSVVLCTATQPALDAERFEGGLALGPGRELAPDPARLHRALVRVRLERVGDLDDEALLDALEGVAQGLVVVNSRAHALALWRAARARGLTGVVHLSTRRHARDRQTALAAIRVALKTGAPCRLIATSLVEAGVDIDFPRVWRAEAGLDQIVQAAGRCNREGKNPVEESIVTVFRAPDHPSPREIRSFAADLGRIADRHDDLTAPAAIADYFGEVYWRKGADLDRDHVLEAFRLSGREPDFCYRTVGERFRLVESEMSPVIVPTDEAARAVIRALAAENPIPPGVGARRLQPWLVQVPRKAFGELVALGHVRFVREDRWEQQFAELITSRLYDPDCGLLWEEAGDLGLDRAII